MVVVSSNFSAPVEGILLETPSTKLLVNGQELGTATLYITENNVVWGGGVRPTGGPAPTISLLYPSISLHAVQRDPSPALYMVLNYELRLPELTTQSGGGDSNTQDDDDDDDFDAEDQPITQLRFVPQSESELQAMYAAMSQGQSLHPDPADELDDDDNYLDGEEFHDGEEEFEDAEESAGVDAGGGAGAGVGAGAGAGEEAAARMRHLRLDHNGAQHYHDAEDEEIGEE